MHGAFLGAFSALIINSRGKDPLWELERGGWWLVWKIKKDTEFIRALA